jgi:hypothetical protein
MKLYIEQLFTPNTSHLKKPKEEIHKIIISEEGIIYHGVNDKKLVIHNDSSSNYTTHTISNIKLIEDTTKTSFKSIYNIPLNFHTFTLKKNIYSIKNIKFVIEYYNEKLYNMYFYQYNLEKDKILIENTLKEIKMKY